MSENLDQPTPEQPPQTQIPEFIRLVMQALEQRKIKPRCHSCDCIGWANFSIVPNPVGSPIIGTANMIPSACFICLKCGAMTYRNLAALGLTITQEQRRVITPDQLQQPNKPLIVTG